mgnify:CR=1 FL=1
MTKKNMYLRIKESEQDMLREDHRKINNKLNLTFGVGLNLNLITGTNEEVITIISVEDSSNNYKDIFYAKSDGQNSINFSSELSIGTQYKTKNTHFDL